MSDEPADPAAGTGWWGFAFCGMRGAVETALMGPI